MIPELKVPYLHEKHVERAANELLHKYAKEKGKPVRAPIDVENILEGYFKLDLVYIDLPDFIGVPDVLGATFIKDQRVFIDESLMIEGKEGPVGDATRARCRRASSPAWCWEFTRPDQPWLLDWRVGTCPWPTTPNGTETRAIYVAASGGRCRPWIGLGTRWHRARRGLAICHEHDDCRRSLALGVACVEARS